MRKRDIFIMYSSGLCELLLAALGFSILALMVLQIGALMVGSVLDGDGVLLFSWQIIVLMALWPGQTFWTIQRETPSGQVHSIIGVPSEDDERIINRRMAQRIRNMPRD